MRFLHLSILLAFLLVHTAPCEAQNPETGSKLGADWIAVLNQHDISKLLNFYTDSIKMESPNWEGIKTGKAGVSETYSRYFAGTPDMHYQLTNTVVGQHAVVIEYTSTGIFSNPEKGTPEYMKGKQYTLKNIARFDLENGLISRQVSYFDQVAFLRQVGFFDQK